MLLKLTKEQEALILKIRDKWIERAYNPVQKTNTEIKQAVNGLYELCNLKKPEYVLIVDSPLGIQCAYNLLKNTQIENSVWSSVENSVRDSVWSSVENSVRSSVENSVRSSVENSVRSSVGDSVWSSVENSVRSSVENSVRSSVENSVRSSVGDSKQELCPLSSYMNLSDYGWTSYYDFFSESQILHNEKFNKWKQILETGIVESAFFTNVAIVSRPSKPIKYTTVNGVRVMHCETGAAIEYNDGYQLYRLWGARFDGNDVKLWEKIISKTMTFKEIQAIGNSDQRAVAMRMNPNALLNEDAELLDKSKRGNELWLVKNVFPDFPKAYFVKMTCPSTGRIFVEGVDPKLAEASGRADECQAVLCGLNYEEYKLLKNET